MYTLYHSPQASSTVPMAVLEEIGVPYRVENVEIRRDRPDENITRPEYLAINPKGRVPALLADGQVLTECPAILTFLARSHPEAGLIPASAAAEARCHEWMYWLATGVHATAFSQAVRPQRFSAEASDWPRIQSKGKANVGIAFRHAEQLLVGDGWAVPEGFSIADIYLLWFYVNGLRAGVPMSQVFPKWSAHAEKTASREAVHRGFAKAGFALQRQPFGVAAA